MLFKYGNNSIYYIFVTGSSRGSSLSSMQTVAEFGLRVRPGDGVVVIVTVKHS